MLRRLIAAGLVSAALSGCAFSDDVNVIRAYDVEPGVCVQPTLVWDLPLFNDGNAPRLRPRRCH